MYKICSHPPRKKKGGGGDLFHLCEMWVPRLMSLVCYQTRQENVFEVGRMSRIKITSKGQTGLGNVMV